MSKLKKFSLRNFPSCHAARAGLLAWTQRPEAAHAACCEALEPNRAGRQWPERLAALLDIP
jgi:predicted RNA polymerase sigma factor